MTVEQLFQSTPPARAATRAVLIALNAARVSIHAAREGGDVRAKQRIANAAVSIHAAREGGDASYWGSACAMPRFNPRRPRGRRPAGPRRQTFMRLFQSTPPARAATIAMTQTDLPGLFQSTPPARAATIMLAAIAIAADVSIHAAREGGDSRPSSVLPVCLCFNPRRPRGRRHLFGMRSERQAEFQSTPPARAATLRQCWRLRW